MPAPRVAVPTGPWHDNHPQHGQRAQPGQPAPVPSLEPWLSELSELSELSDCYRTAIGLDSQIATIGTIGHYRTLSETIGAAQRSSAIGSYRKLSELSELSEYYRSYIAVCCGRHGFSVCRTQLDTGCVFSYPERSCIHAQTSQHMLHNT